MHPGKRVKILRIPAKLSKRRKVTKRIPAMEYRIPMQVTEILRLCHSGYYPICPRCHQSIDREYMRFCDRCGQHLGWDEFEKVKVVYAVQEPE